MLAIRKGLRNEQGFTLVEVTIILLVLVILSTIMLPQLGNFNRLARYVKVKEDVGALCATLKKFLDEVMLPGPYLEPGGNGANPPALPVGLLVGPGSIPSLSLAVDGNTPGSPDGDVWEEVIGDQFDMTPDDGGSDVTFEVDDMRLHLQVNNPALTAAPDPDIDQYKNVIANVEVGPFFGWRGPYFDEITSDPWGTRYSVNTFGLHTGDDGGSDNIFSTAVICISFGPDKTADTFGNQPINIAPYGFALGGDDIAAVLSGVGPF